MKQLLLILALAMPQAAWSWGPLGHEVPAQLAEEILSPKARALVNNILPGENLSEVSTWADRMRSNKDAFWQKTARPFHYVTVPDGQVYDIRKAPAKGDAVTALKRFRAILDDRRSSNESQQLALRFSIHIVGDLHQPLHVGNGNDLGGNRVRIGFDARSTNLHRLWDSGLIYARGMDREDWLSHLRAGLTAEQVKQWQEHRPQQWIAESQLLPMSQRRHR